VRSPSALAHAADHGSVWRGPGSDQKEDADMVTRGAPVRVQMTETGDRPGARGVSMTELRDLSADRVRGVWSR